MLMIQSNFEIMSMPIILLVIFFKLIYFKFTKKLKSKMPIKKDGEVLISI